MRGKAVEFYVDFVHDGITPAYAGKSDAHMALITTFGDHPRLCGEKQQQQDIFRWIPGSPPPMRGKV